MIGVNMCLDVFFYQPFENNVLFLNTPMALCPQVMWMPRILLSFDESEIVVDATKKLTKKRNHVSYAKPLNFWYPATTKRRFLRQSWFVNFAMTGKN